MALNVGPKKSAVMIYSPKAGRNVQEAETFRVGTKVLPTVEIYKYLGVIISSMRSPSTQLRTLREKVQAKTGQSVAWCRFVEHNLMPPTCPPC